MRHAFTLLALLLLVSACDSSANDLDRGQFEARLIGDVSRSLDGFAVFVTQDTESSGVLTTISMNEDRVSPRGLSLIGPVGLLSQTGTVDLGTAGGAVLIYTEAGSGQVTVLFSTSGTLTMTRAADGERVGSFTAELSSEVGTAAVTAEIEGSFEAVGANL